MSLPVSKQLLNANYITCIVLTLIGTLVSLYAYEANVIEPNSIYFSTAYAFVISNFLSIPIAFSQFTGVESKCHMVYTCLLLSF